ncbi:hypothetical protein, partial [Kitasatospora herbaricolor]|uniref:hypothetical protein n=1 Tax=Kitasatospora herbaricolor TaxID=68217 RepID=UPI0036DD1023
EGRRPDSVRTWLAATFRMLDLYADVCRDIAGTDYRHLEKMTPSGSIGSGLRAAYRGALEWIAGAQFRDIEAAIEQCDRSEVVDVELARKLVLTLLPRTISYAMQLLTGMALELIEWDTPLERAVAESAVSCVQKGFDTPVKLAFAATVRSNPTRRQVLDLLASGPVADMVLQPSDDYGTIAARVQATVGLTPEP